MEDDQPADVLAKFQLARRLFERCEIGEDRVCVDAAHPERARRRALADLCGVTSPLARHGELGRPRVVQQPRNVRVDVVEVQGRHDGRRLDGRKGEQAAGQAGRALAVSHRGLGRDECLDASHVSGRDTADLDRVSEYGARPVAGDGRDVVASDAAVGHRRPNQGRLRGAVRRRQSTRFTRMPDT